MTINLTKVAIAASFVLSLASPVLAQTSPVPGDRMTPSTTGAISPALDPNCATLDGGQDPRTINPALAGTTGASPCKNVPAGGRGNAGADTMTSPMR